MNIQDFVNLIRTRWLSISIATLIGLLGAIVVTLLTTPLYQASTRLFVSTTSGASTTDLYQGNRLSQDRVASYTQLLMGETLAQRTIDQLDLDMSAQDLQAHVQATSKRDTVLIDVNVLDRSPVRARDIAETLSAEFVGLVRELETPSPGIRPDARVVIEQHASISDKPVIPKPTRNILVGIAIGLMAGIGLAALRDIMDNTIKTQTAVEDITGVSLVGNIPLDKERKKDPAIPFETDNSSSGEAFRKLRTNLHFLSVDNPPRMIVITSSAPGEGKSTTSINIALALAEAEHSVVLVDADMRRPSLHSYLNLIGQVGFSSVLSGTTSLSEALQETKFPNLTVLAAGVSPPNPSELLGSQAAKKILSDLREQYDYVVIDTSPLLAVTDAAVIAAESDGVLIMVRFGHTKREQLKHSVEMLQSVGAPLLGAVFTMTPTRGTAYYKYNYYGAYGREQKIEVEGLTATIDHEEIRPEGSQPSRKRPQGAV